MTTTTLMPASGNGVSRSAAFVLAALAFSLVFYVLAMSFGGHPHASQPDPPGMTGPVGMALAPPGLTGP